MLCFFTLRSLNPGRERMFSEESFDADQYRSVGYSVTQPANQLVRQGTGVVSVFSVTNDDDHSGYSVPVVVNNQINNSGGGMDSSRIEVCVSVCASHCECMYLCKCNIKFCCVVIVS